MGTASFILGLRQVHGFYFAMWSDCSCSGTQVSMTSWTFLTQNGLLLVQKGVRLEVLGKLGLDHWEKITKQHFSWGLASSPRTWSDSHLFFLNWLTFSPLYSLKTKWKIIHYYWSSAFPCPVLSLFLLCAWLSAKMRCLILSRNSSSGSRNHSYLWPCYPGVHPQQPHCHLH